MATYIEIQNRVKVNIIDLPTPVQTAVPRLVNRAKKMLQRKHNFLVMKAVHTFNTVAAPTISSTTMPSDFKSFRDKMFWTPETGRPVEIARAPTLSAVNRRFDADDEGSPQLLLETLAETTGVSTWNIYPLSDTNSDYADGEYRITIPYWKYLADFSLDADTDFFSTNADDFIEFMATAEGFRMDWDMDQYDQWKSDAMIEYGQVLRDEKLRTLSGFDTLVPHPDYYEPQL